MRSTSWRAGSGHVVLAGGLHSVARVAEALQCSTRPPWRAADGADPEALQFLDAQWRRNAMMVKWLAYLVERGHGFVHAARPRNRMDAEA